MPPPKSNKQKKFLLIVESPAKAKTIQGYLGDGFEVVASGGHIMDLPSQKLSVDTDNKFQIHKTIIPSKKKSVDFLIKKIKNYSRIYVATDPDREGEAIGYDIRSLGGKPYLQDSKEWIRVAFREITKDYIQSKLKKPDSFSEPTLNAQITRRIVDRLFGYMVSPLLWKKIPGSKSAGRVQSVILRWICEREEEIRNFKPQKYMDMQVFDDLGFEYIWIREKETGSPGEEFMREWRNITGIHSFEERKEFQKKGVISLSTNFSLESINSQTKKNYPPPPFKTSSLQEVASKILGFSPAKTMKIAQSLFEGKDIGKTRTGLITYPRTDSTRLASSIEKEGKSIIEKEWGKNFVGKKSYSGPSSQSGKKIQDAHEAIRPTILYLKEDTLKNSLSLEEYKLYDLILKRFLASLTAPQEVRVETRILKGWGERWQWTDEEELFAGYKIFYNQKEKKTNKKNPYTKGNVPIRKLEWEEKETSPPPRYTHASLVKKMEATGVGRPSTYSPSIEILSTRDYIVWEKKSCKPTALGEEVIRFLKVSMDDFIRDDFTKNLEVDLDRIESAEESKLEVLERFYSQLKTKLEQAPGKFSESKKCPECGNGIVQTKREKSGKIILYCSRFPECDYGEYK